MGVEDGQKVNVIGLSSPGLCGFMLWLLGNYDEIYEVISGVIQAKFRACLALEPLWAMKFARNIEELTVYPVNTL